MIAYKYWKNVPRGKKSRNIVKSAEERESRILEKIKRELAYLGHVDK